MTKGILKFWDENGNSKLVEIHYRPGFTCCGDCPIRRLYPDFWSVTNSPTCSIRAREYGSDINNCGPFINGNAEYFFCSGVKIVAATEIRSEEVEIELGDSLNRQKKVSLGELIANVCPGRCIFMEDTSKCTKAHRKCPGCLLEELNI